MSASIRPATPDDLDAVVAFGAAAVPSHYAPILGAEAARAQLDWWTRERMGPAILAGRVHVAIDSDSLAGVCETGELADDQVIWKLYLAPDARGHGLGTELLRHAIDALPAGAGHVLVEHFAGNTRAGRFYQREGFTIVRTQDASSGDPNAAIVWRRRDLDPDPGLAGLRFELFVRDVQTSVRFYRSTLGLKPPTAWSPDGYVSISAGVVKIGVQHLANLPAGHHFSPDRLAGPRGVGLEIVVEADDVDLAYANAASHAERCGGRIEPLQDQPWGLRDFRLIDPDGYYVRVTSHRR